MINYNFLKLLSTVTFILGIGGNVAQSTEDIYQQISTETFKNCRGGLQIHNASLVRNSELKPLTETGNEIQKKLALEAINSYKNPVDAIFYYNSEIEKLNKQNHNKQIEDLKNQNKILQSRQKTSSTAPLRFKPESKPKRKKEPEKLKKISVKRSEEVKDNLPQETPMVDLLNSLYQTKQNLINIQPNKELSQLELQTMQEIILLMSSMAWPIPKKVEKMEIKATYKMPESFALLVEKEMKAILGEDLYGGPEFPPILAVKIYKDTDGDDKKIAGLLAKMEKEGGLDRFKKSQALENNNISIEGLNPEYVFLTCDHWLLKDQVNKEN